MYSKDSDQTGQMARLSVMLGPQALLLVLSCSVSFSCRRQPEKPKEEPKPQKKPSPRPMSAKYRQRQEFPLPPPRPTVINMPELQTQEDVTVSNATQTSDTVGIQTEKKLLEEYDPVSLKAPLSENTRLFDCSVPPLLEYFSEINFRFHYN